MADQGGLGCWEGFCGDETVGEGEKGGEEEGQELGSLDGCEILGGGWKKKWRREDRESVP